MLEPGEDHRSPRTIDSLGPQYATRIHSYFEWAPAMLSTVPGGEDWLARIDAERPPNERNLSVHEGHLVAVTERDAPLIVCRQGRSPLQSVHWDGNRGGFHLDTVGAAGVTEVVYNPTGPHVARDLEAFAAAAQCGRVKVDGLITDFLYRFQETSVMTTMWDDRSPRRSEGGIW